MGVLPFLVVFVLILLEKIVSVYLVVTLLADRQQLHGTCLRISIGQRKIWAIPQVLDVVYYGGAGISASAFADLTLIFLGLEDGSPLAPPVWRIVKAVDLPG